eukprot:TRINITY_DN54378_c0_g1_i1.p1 TRINITY_DN54378_c0_g1~~TRINITY_DN54378_c0_g1_i1.p1  ORF type:complete len:567 (+),score=138.89 TRINITY_DN54378_c0_g1_i1:102-1703(+)
MDALTMMQGAGQGGVIASNAGYSGTPLWKIKQQRASAMPVPNAAEEAAAASAQQEAEEQEAAEQLRVCIDAVSIGRAEGAGEKPLVRHVIVKDLRKVAARSKLVLPSGGCFENRVPVMLFALFDGQSCADAPGPYCAEWCSKQLLPKLLRNLSALPPGYENDTFLKATLKKTFEDLDKDILTGQPAIHDGCGASVVLTVGEKMFTAVCGKCQAIHCEGVATKNGQVNYTATNRGEKQGLCHLPEEQKFLTENGGVMFQAEGGAMLVTSPNGAVAAVSRSMGDRAWKGPQGGIPGSVKLLRASPETQVVDLKLAEKTHCVVLSSAPMQAMTKENIGKLASQFTGKPRAVAGELAQRVSQMPQNTGQQCTAVTIFFLPKEDKPVQQPAAKKAKKEAESVRLRHIVVKYRDLAQPVDPVRNRPATRSREEAEAILRRALLELSEEASKIKLPADASKAKLAALQPTPRYIALCKELSECTTAQKGGGMLGDLGWQTPGELTRYGPTFAETARSLGVGQWSDLTPSEHGIHILQRIA